MAGSKKRPFGGVFGNLDINDLANSAQQLANSAQQLVETAGDAAGRIGAGVTGATEGFLKGINGGNAATGVEDEVVADVTVDDAEPEELLDEEPEDYAEANEGMAELIESIDEEAEAADGAGAAAQPKGFGFVDDEVKDAMDEQDDEAVAYAKQFLLHAIRLRGVKIERDTFLQQELAKKGLSQTQIDLAITERPAAAGIDPEVLDAIARESIAFETNKSTWMSFAAGLPGGFAMIGAIPADITQYYVHAFRIMQKLAYVYGWDNFLEDTKDTDDETLAKLAFFFGSMVGVGAASAGLKAFAGNAAKAVAKNVAKATLTKTTWYPMLKSVMRTIGVKVTKVGVGKAAGKVVPVIGGVVSGAMTFVTLTNESKNLQKQLKKLPQACPVAEWVIDEDEQTVA